MPDALVVNASPLIFLGNADRIELLRSVGVGRVVVPEPVHTEVVETKHADRAGSWGQTVRVYGRAVEGLHVLHVEIQGL